MTEASGRTIVEVALSRSAGSMMLLREARRSESFVTCLGFG